MYNINKTIPEGTRDLLYSEAELYDRLTESFSKIYELNGFKKIITPVIENYDLIAAVNRSIKQENLYKLTDNTGQLLVIRPDNTTPIARVAATKLKKSVLPQKLFYNQNIYRINSDYSGKRNEILQSGIEIIGATGLKADLLCIMTALEVIKSLNMNCKLEIGHVGYFNAIVDELKLDENDTMEVRNFVESKNFVSLNMLNGNLLSEKIRKMPLLFGNDEVFKDAKVLAGDNNAAIDALDYVEKLYNMLNSAGYGDDIMVDMGMVHKFDYYTGVVFRGYIENAGEPVLKGGRYDRLLANFDYDMPATGFAINVCSVADAIIKSSELPAEKSANAIVHYDEESFCDAIIVKNSYLKKGLICELSVFDDIIKTNNYAEKMNIKEVINIIKSPEVIK